MSEKKLFQPVQWSVTGRKERTLIVFVVQTETSGPKRKRLLVFVLRQWWTSSPCGCAWKTIICSEQCRSHTFLVLVVGSGCADGRTNRGVPRSVSYQNGAKADGRSNADGQCMERGSHRDEMDPSDKSDTMTTVVSTRSETHPEPLPSTAEATSEECPALN